MRARSFVLALTGSQRICTNQAHRAFRGRHFPSRPVRPCNLMTYDASGVPQRVLYGSRPRIGRRNRPRTVLSRGVSQWSTRQLHKNVSQSKETASCPRLRLGSQDIPLRLRSMVIKKPHARVPTLFKTTPGAHAQGEASRRPPRSHCQTIFPGEL